MIQLLNEPTLYNLENFNFEIESNLVDLENLDLLNKNKKFKNFIVSSLIKLSFLSKKLFELCGIY